MARYRQKNSGIVFAECYAKGNTVLEAMHNIHTTTADDRTRPGVQVMSTPRGDIEVEDGEWIVQFSTGGDKFIISNTEFSNYYTPEPG